MDRRAFLARSGLGLLGTFAPRIAFAGTSVTPSAR